MDQKLSAMSPPRYYNWTRQGWSTHVDCTSRTERLLLPDVRLINIFAKFISVEQFRTLIIQVTDNQNKLFAGDYCQLPFLLLHKRNLIFWKWCNKSPPPPPPSKISCPAARLPCSVFCESHALRYWNNEQTELVYGQDKIKKILKVPWLTIFISAKNAMWS